MKKKFKVTLVVFLVVVLGCFSQAFAATNQNEKLSRIVKQIRNVKLLDSTTTSSSTQDEEVDQYTKLLMHMDDGTFKDDCGHAVTNNGVVLDTANKKFDNGSASFNGSNSHLTISNSDDFNFKNNDFTIDCWVYPLSFNGLSTLFAKRSNTATYGGMAININSNGELAITATSNGSSWDIAQVKVIGPKLELNQWNHVAVCRNGDSIYGFVNGIEGSDILKTSATILPNTSDVIINEPTSNTDGITHFNGYIDEYRVSNIARWTSNFTPPTDSYNNVLATGIALNKTTDLLPVGQTDTLTATVTPDNSTNKAVTWTSSDSSIATVDSTGKITGLKAGTATITATTTDGSNLSAACTVTVTDSSTPTPTPTNNSDKSVLNITMTNGQVKQYNVTMDTVNKFISWYRLRSAGSGDPFYEFDITQTSSPDIIKTDYVVFDKISSFEVDDYTK